MNDASGWAYQDHLADYVTSVAELRAGADQVRERRAFKAALSDLYILTEQLANLSDGKPFYKSTVYDGLVNGLRQVRGVVVHDPGAAIDFQKRHIVLTGYGMGPFGAGPYGGAAAYWLWQTGIPAAAFHGERDGDYVANVAGRGVVDTLEKAAIYLGSRSEPL